MKPFERKAIEEAIAAVRAAIETLKKSKVSVRTDYACGCAISSLDGALADLERELIE